MTTYVSWVKMLNNRSVDTQMHFCCNSQLTSRVLSLHFIKRYTQLRLMTRINTFLTQCSLGPGGQELVLRFNLILDARVVFNALLFIFIVIFVHLIWFMEMFFVKFKFLPHNLLDILRFKHSSQFLTFLRIRENTKYVDILFNHEFKQMSKKCIPHFYFTCIHFTL